VKASITTKTFIKRILVFLFWILVWIIVDLSIDNPVVFAGPAEVIRALLSNVNEQDFLLTILFSVMRIGAGFLTALILGIVLGSISFSCKAVKELLTPLVNVIKSVPIVSFVVLLLIWAGTSFLSFFISFLIVFPQIYISTVSGLENTDQGLVKMADTFRFGMFEKAFYIYREALNPFLMSSVKISCGMAWKAGVAAEVIGLPQFAIGTRIYNSKIYLETADLFAWTIIVLLLSYLFEKIFVYLFAGLSKIRPCPKKIKDAPKCKYKEEYILNNINVSFGNEVVLSGLNLELKLNEIYCLMGPSGIGKTTLLNEIEKKYRGRVSRVFQKDFLLPEYSGLANVMLGANGEKVTDVRCELEGLISNYDDTKPVKEYSGGMQRRIALLRALLNKSELLLLDEPFNGLDSDNQKVMIELINKYRQNRTLIVVTHDNNIPKLLNGQVLYLNGPSVISSQ